MPENHYQIIQVEEGFVRDGAGNPVRGYKVYFSWGDGRRDFVEMPKDRATPENRDRLIEDAIARQEALWG